MFKKIKYILIAIGGVLTALLFHNRDRVLGLFRKGDDSIGNTVNTVSRGIEDSKATVNELTDTVKSSTDTSKELEVGIGLAESSVGDAQTTVSNIRRLIQARRETIEEEQKGNFGI